MQAHGDQRYGEHPYAYHLDAVVKILTSYGEEAQVVGYLHDVAEDTAVGLGEIERRFGDQVAVCVAVVSDAQGSNRRERKARTNEKLAAARPEWYTALIVKAADRLANLRESARSGNGSKLGMYRREHEAFRRAAYRPGLCDDLWAEMDQILGRTAPGE